MDWGARRQIAPNGQIGAVESRAATPTRVRCHWQRGRVRSRVRSAPLAVALGSCIWHGAYLPELMAARTCRAARLTLRGGRERERARASQMGFNKSLMRAVARRDGRGGGGRHFRPRLTAPAHKGRRIEIITCAAAAIVAPGNKLYQTPMIFVARRRSRVSLLRQSIALQTQTTLDDPREDDSLFVALGAICVIYCPTAMINIAPMINPDAMSSSSEFMTSGASIDRPTDRSVSLCCDLLCLSDRLKRCKCAASDDRKSYRIP